MEINERLRSVASEYAEAVGKILGYEPEYWVGSDISIDCCCFGDVEFLTLAEMQVIIDHLPHWIELYGSEEKVGDVVLAWLMWSTTDNWDEEHGLWRSRPRINLWSWMGGLRPDDLKWTDVDELVKLETQEKVLTQIAQDYPTASVGNALTQIQSRIKAISSRMTAERLETINYLSKQKNE